MSLREEETPSVVESGQVAEAKLRNVQRLLMNAGPEAFERCETELNEVIAKLQELISAGSGNWNPAVSASLVQIQRMAGRLRLQVEHGSNFWMGWLQLRLGAGYDQQGLPAFVTHDARSCFEG